MDNNLQDFRNNNQEILKQSQDDFEKQLNFISVGTLKDNNSKHELTNKFRTNSNDISKNQRIIVTWNSFSQT